MTRSMSCWNWAYDQIAIGIVAFKHFQVRDQCWAIFCFKETILCGSRFNFLHARGTSTRRRSLRNDKAITKALLDMPIRISFRDNPVPGSDTCLGRYTLLLHHY